jgi:hypothetical protein
MTGFAPLQRPSEDFRALLHPVGQSTEGGNITKADKRTLLERKKAAEADYKANEVRYKRDYAIRAQVRAALEAARQPKPKGA